MADKASLAADSAAAASHVDANLVNPWGLVFASGAPAWIANNHSNTSTLYDGLGDARALIVSLPDQTKNPSATQQAAPSGIVFNAGGASDFVIGSGSGAGPASFIFDGEDGIIYGWSKAAGAVIAYTATDGAAYKGLAFAGNGGANFLYATDFKNGKVDVFNNAFNKVSGSGGGFSFTDPKLPAGYAPYGIQAISSGGATQIFVAYAKPDGGTPVPDNLAGAGLGLVDVFDTAGNFVKTLVPAGGVLNGPWGMALAPADFGAFGGALLVGNFGDFGTDNGSGAIDAFDPSSGKFLGALSDASGKPLLVAGLWGLAFGNDASGLNQPHNTLFFTAGSNGENDGVYGRIDPGSAPPAFPRSLAISAPAAGSTVSATVTVSASAQDVSALSSVQFLAGGSVIGSASAAPFSVQWDTTKAANGSVALTATATDAAGNTLSAAPVNVTVSNAAPAVTLTQLQQQFFTPICSQCHTGNGSFLPGSQNLTAGNTYGQIVNHPSVEVPSLLRIKPNDPANSYLIQKIMGTQGAGNGSRMPDGCPATQPCLTQDQINMFISWVNSGAPNN